MDTGNDTGSLQAQLRQATEIIQDRDKKLADLVDKLAVYGKLDSSLIWHILDAKIVELTSKISTQDEEHKKLERQLKAKIEALEEKAMKSAENFESTEIE